MTGTRLGSIVLASALALPWSSLGRVRTGSVEIAATNPALRGALRTLAAANRMMLHTARWKSALPGRSVEFWGARWKRALPGGLGAAPAGISGLGDNKKLSVKWIHGSADCSKSTDPAIQVYRFDSDTYIFRESKCLNFEGPFMYLLIGKKGAVLVDSGAAPPKGVVLPIHDVVEQALGEWAEAHHRSKASNGIELTVVHSHGHRDHTYGDSQFEGQPNTMVVKPDVDSVKSFFKLNEWPEGSATLDLGGRVLTILPAPGHQAAHIAIYDSKTHILLTGDMLYPGLLTVDDWPEYRKSVKRLVDFASSHPVSYILGAHIEMSTTAKQMYPLGSTYQPDEHPLEMSTKDLADLQQACDALGDKPVKDVHDNFIIFPRNH